MFESPSNFLSTWKLIFVRTKRQEKLKTLLRILRNEYSQLKNESGASYLKKINGDDFNENLQSDSFDVKCNRSINLHLNKDNNINLGTKDIGGYLIQKAISNARTKAMKKNIDNIYNDTFIMSNQIKIDDNASNSEHNESFQISSIGSFNEELFLENAFESILNIGDANLFLKHENSTSSQESTFFKLKEEVDYQSQMIMEISKLLDTFKENIQFYGSPEHLVAEKLMLLGCYRHDHLIKNIRDNYYETMDKNSAILGSVKLSDFKIPLLISTTNNFNEWFICIVSCGEEIFISEPVKVHYNWIRFEEMFSFHNICWDSVIDINVYSMRIPKLGTLKKLLNKKICSNYQSKKLLYKDLRTYDLVECQIRNSMFCLCGTATMNVQELKKKITPHLDVVNNYPLENKFYLTNNFGDLRYISKHSGFLTIGEEATGNYTWNRKWCVLEGTIIKYWNYPIDEEFKAPIGVLDLKKSTTTTIKLAQRNICAKPRTFLIEFDANKFYFSADTSEDLKVWLNILDEITICLNGWNLLSNCKK